MEELLLEDDQMTNNIKTSIKKGKKDKNDDFSLLNQALASAPKTKKQKEEEQKKKDLEEKEKQQEFMLKKEEDLLKKEAEIKNAKLKNINMDHHDDLLVKIDNNLENNIQITGIDNALDVLNNKSKTMSYNEYYKEQLVLLKETYPNLRLSQYNERINNQWKKVNLILKI